MFRPALLTAAAASLLAIAACSDKTDDVVQPPAPGAAAEPVTETRAAATETATALAFGMTRAQLEDADLVSSDYTDLGDVETLVLDAAGTLREVVIELEGPGDRKVAVPITSIRGAARDNGAFRDLTTELTAAQLAALPEWTAPRGG
ncbi:MAG: hypothetical protein ACK4UQ_12160 [Brevundimonas sp.]|nr:MAG: hypothetical protein EON86_07225 [Brevundimonas sp.]